MVPGGVVMLRCRLLGCVAWALVLLAAVAGQAVAQKQPAGGLTDRQSAPIDRERFNQNTISILGGKSSSTQLAIIEDIATVLDNGDELRVLPLVGKGAAQNVRDILFLRGMDLGITQANVMAYFKKTGELGPNIEGRLTYVTKLFSEELHVVAGASTADLYNLEGKTVNFGAPGSGTELTAALLFATLKIAVKPVNMEQADALAKIKSGEIAATVLLTGKPAGALAKVRSSDELKLLPIPFEEALEADYLPAQFTHDDYPDLIAEGETVDSIAVSAVLAAYNWSPGSDRYRRLAKFVEALLNKFPEFRKEPRHPKWKEVNLAATLPGWQRLPVAQQWVDAHAGPSKEKTAAVQKKTFEQFLANQRRGGRGGGGVPNQIDEEALFKKFVEWMQAQKGSGGGGAPSPTAGAGGGNAGASSGGGAPGNAASRLW